MPVNKKEKTHFGIAIFDEGVRIFFAKGSPLSTLKQISKFIFEKYRSIKEL